MAYTGVARAGFEPASRDYEPRKVPNSSIAQWTWWESNPRPEWYHMWLSSLVDTCLRPLPELTHTVLVMGHHHNVWPANAGTYQVTGRLRLQRM
jgi:hypothetical protein